MSIDRPDNTLLFVNNSQRFPIFDKVIRDLLGIKDTEDLKEQNAQLMAAAILFIQNNLYYYLLLTNQIALLQELFWKLDNKDILPEIRESYERAVTHEVTIQKTVDVTQTSTNSVTYPIDFEQFSHLPPYDVYSFLNAEFKRINYSYQSAQSGVYHTAQQSNLNFLNRMSTSFPLNNQISTLYSELLEQQLLMDKEYDKPCLLGDGTPDFAAMEKKSNYLKEIYAITTQKIEELLDSLPQKNAAPFREEFNAMKVKTKEELREVDELYKPILDELATKMSEYNKVVAGELDKDLEDFRTILKRTVTSETDVRITNCQKELSKLQAELKKDSNDFERFQSILNQCSNELNKISDLFEKDPNLSNYIEQFRSLKGSIEYKINNQPKTLDDFQKDRSLYIPKQTQALFTINGIIPSAPVMDDDYVSVQNATIEAAEKYDLGLNNTADRLSEDIHAVLFQGASAPDPDPINENEEPPAFFDDAINSGSFDIQDNLKAPISTKTEAPTEELLINNENKLEDQVIAHSDVTENNSVLVNGSNIEKQNHFKSRLLEQKEKDKPERPKILDKILAYLDNIELESPSEENTDLHINIRVCIKNIEVSGLNYKELEQLSTHLDDLSDVYPEVIKAIIPELEDLKEQHANTSLLK